MKKDLFTELIPTQAYHHILETKKESNKFFVLNKRKELSNREKLIKVCNQSLNKRFKDGRIYHLDSDGNYSSHSVSPHSSNFLLNIELKIKNLVLALQAKNYFTISSCQGHGIYFKRYVTIIFPSQETALSFIGKLPFNLSYKLGHASEVLNNSLDVDDNGNILGIKKSIPNHQKESAIDYINCFIRRPYSDAWLLEMTISPALEVKRGFFFYLKNIKEIIFKKFFMDFYTSRITKFILSDKFEQNLY